MILINKGKVLRKIDKFLCFYNKRIKKNQIIENSVKL